MDVLFDAFYLRITFIVSNISRQTLTGLITVLHCCFPLTIKLQNFDHKTNI